MKKCSCCALEKDESEFFKKRETSLEGFCKKCKRQKVLDRQALNPEKYREKERLRSEQRRQTSEWKDWRKDHQKRNRQEISKKSREYWEKSERVRKKAKEWSKNNRDKINASVHRHNKRNPFKHAARVYLGAAIKEGILNRPHKCSGCLKECKPEAHHEDYMKPLEVIWLCRSCHGKEHRKHR